MVPGEAVMSAELKKSTGWSMVLIALGVAALCVDPRWLGLLIPAAAFVWYAAGPVMRSRRN